MVMSIPFIYNILKQHPALMVLVQRDDPETPETLLADPFLAGEENPQLTNAIDSSLWEIYTLRSHYHAPVSTLAKIFEEAFTKPNYAMEDFLDSTYSTVSKVSVIERQCNNWFFSSLKVKIVERSKRSLRWPWILSFAKRTLARDH
jgi:U3 small nucleolar RNA-associated protein 19